MNTIKRLDSWFFISAKYRNLCSSSNHKHLNTIYHCCIQKSASQWFGYFWKDPLIRQYLNLIHIDPKDDFLLRNRRTRLRLRLLPSKEILGPLFIRYHDYHELPKSDRSKTFYVMRDPRDVIISSYYSALYSHNPNHEINAMREILSNSTKSEGLEFLIHSSQIGVLSVLDEWIHAPTDERVKFFKYEDLFGESQFKTFQSLMKHLSIDISDDELQEVLSRNQFQKISGRHKGTENVHHHYRKGVAGDWKNHFTEEHKKLFKTLSRNLLQELGYEKDYNW